MYASKQILRVFNYEREQTRGEEIANSISHRLGLVAAMMATPFILIRQPSSMILGT